MRRKDREITDPEEIRSLLDAARVLRLGLVDGEWPYIVPLHYGWTLEGDRLVFYCHGARGGHKIDLIRQSARCFVELDTGEELISGGEKPCDYGAAYRSLMGRGSVRLVESPEEKLRGLELLMRTQTGRDFPMTAQMALAVAVLRIELESFSVKARKKP